MAADVQSKPKLLNCIVKKLVPLKIGDSANDNFKSGVAVVDVIFPGNSSVELGKAKLTFKNCYTASITIKLKILNGEAMKHG